MISLPDIVTTLNLLTPLSRCVDLHKEAGQMDDIKGFIQSFMQKDQEMQTWPAEDRELVIDQLSERANGM